VSGVIVGGLVAGVLLERFVGLPRRDAGGSVAAAALPAEVSASAALTPEQVVRAQMACLAKVGDPAHPQALAECYAHASPANRSVIGTLEQFGELLHEAPYDVLLRQQLTMVGTPVVRGDSATLLVSVLDDTRKLTVFRFQLARQHDDPFAGRWMTNAVTLEAQTAPTAAPEPTFTAAR
jgi:hypothetical protein